jgi:dTMP kinase
VPEWAHKLHGRFIVFDGPDGSGKTTQFARFAAWCREHGVPLREVREPGGTAIGEQIRRVLLDPDNEMDLRCEMLLYMASRAQLVSEVIRPALAAGELVLADRFISSTFAYQGTAGGLEREAIEDVGRVALGDCRPDLVVVFDIDAASASRRLTGAAGAPRRPRSRAAAGTAQPTLFCDRLERRGEEFRARVREGYLEQADRDPEHVVLVDARGSEDDVFGRVLATIEARMK